jgi:MFS family permease
MRGSSANEANSKAGHEAGNSMLATGRFPLYAALGASVVSNIGNQFSYIAIPWFVLVTTGSAALTGIVAAAGLVPMIVSGFFSGVLVDRLGAKRMAVVSDIASGAIVAMIPLLHATVGLPFWLLLVLVFLGAILDAPGEAARQSVLPDLVALAGLTPERANSLWMIARRSASLIGAPLAGASIAWFGASNVLWIDAVSFGLSAAILGFALPAATLTGNSPTGGGSYLREVLDGLQFIRTDRLILWMSFVFSLGSLLAEPVYAVILPVYAKQTFGSAFDLGLMFAALGGGSVLGALMFAAIGHRLPRRATMIVAFLGRALTFWVFVAIPPLWVMVIAIGVNAILFEPINPLRMTILQERIPDHLRGRVFGTLSAIGLGTLPIGMVVYGALLSSLGLTSTLYVLAVVNLALPVGMLFIPAFRAMHLTHAGGLQPRPLTTV